MENIRQHLGTIGWIATGLLVGLVVVYLEVSFGLLTQLVNLTS
jgi:hypothetical protein